jgi:hypothetical protein
MADDLAVDRRTLGLAFMCISTWYECEIKRLGAVRAGREFLNLKHSRFPKLKLYSIVAGREWRALQTLTLRRNWPLLDKTLADCGVAHQIEPHRLPRRDYAEFSSAPPPLSGLTEILMRGVELAQDRRRTRYSRLRVAVENGLLPADALKVRRSPKAEETEA